MRRIVRLAFPILVVAAMMALHATGVAGQPRPRRYEDLTTFFTEWRAFQRPKLLGGVPDYSRRAMVAQQRALAAWQRRLAVFDTTGWSIAQQVDFHVVRAELSGLDFDHRVLQPWANNPGFYATVFSDQSDQPAREGPFAVGAVELWSYTFPLSASDAERVAAGVRVIPALLQQARTNLTGNQRDIWVYGTKSMRDQRGELAQLAARLTTSQGALQAEVSRAAEATDAFVAWLEQQAPSKTGRSEERRVGKECA